MAKKNKKQRETPATLAQMRFESEFNRLAVVLREDQFASLHDLPLVHWTRPADRRLPLVFMDWHLKRLLELSFEELYTTPGVGEKKIDGLIALLQRIRRNGHESEVTSAAQSDNAEPAKPAEASETFDPRCVSEAEWQQWCETVERQQLNRLPIGRVMQALCDVPMVIWDVPLGNYLGHTLAEIRGMKTHGHKRVRIVLEAFWMVHVTLQNTAVREHLVLEIVPRSIHQLESWIADQLESDRPPTADELRAGLAQPLFEQLQLDVSERIAELVQSRLGLNGEPVSVRSYAQKIGVTRARVYQWLDDCAKALRIRWPSGRWKVRSLRDKVDEHANESRNQELLTMLCDIFFP